MAVNKTLFYLLPMKVLSEMMGDLVIAITVAIVTDITIAIDIDITDTILPIFLPFDRGGGDEEEELLGVGITQVLDPEPKF